MIIGNWWECLNDRVLNVCPENRFRVIGFVNSTVIPEIRPKALCPGVHHEEIYQALYEMLLNCPREDLGNGRSANLAVTVAYAISDRLRPTLPQWTIPESMTINNIDVSVKIAAQINSKPLSHIRASDTKSEMFRYVNRLVGKPIAECVSMPNNREHLLGSVFDHILPDECRLKLPKHLAEYQKDIIRNYGRIVGRNHLRAVWPTNVRTEINDLAKEWLTS